MMPEHTYEQIFKVLNGIRTPPMPGSGKLLRFMLFSEDGCDAVITPDRFAVVYSPGALRNTYNTSIAPSVVSQLLEWAGIQGPVTEVKGVIEPSAVPPDYHPPSLWG